MWYCGQKIKLAFRRPEFKSPFAHGNSLKDTNNKPLRGIFMCLKNLIRVAINCNQPASM